MKMSKDLEAMLDFMSQHPEKVSGILEQARNTYGNKNQILVCIEELNELAAVLAKYPRYEDEHQAKSSLHDAVLDEVADVVIILEHVQSIMGLSNEEIAGRIIKKVARLSNWLEKSDSMQQTLEDRDLESTSPKCASCSRSVKTDESSKMICVACLKAEATEGIRPFYEPKKG